MNLQSLSIKRLLLILAAVVAIVGLVALILTLFGVSLTGRGAQRSVLAPEYVSAVRSGNFQEIQSQYEAIQSDPGASAQEKAEATLVALGSEARATGDVNARVRDVQEAKKIFLDESLPLRIRVNALKLIAGQYSISGRSTAVFEEIYKEQPFSYYLTLDNPGESARRLFEWSYSLLPTPNAAISIARWYTEQNVLNRLDPESEVYRSNADRGEEFLNRADAAVSAEAQGAIDYENSTPYLTYRYWRAMIIGRLAVQKGEPYTNQYRSVMEDFITFAEAQQNPIAPDYLRYARLFYGEWLVRNNESVAAKAQLDLLAENLNAMTDTGTSVFVGFLRQEYTNNRDGLNWRNIETAFEVSPNLRAAVEALVAAR